MITEESKIEQKAGPVIFTPQPTDECSAPPVEKYIPSSEGRELDQPVSLSIEPEEETKTNASQMVCATLPFSSPVTVTLTGHSVSLPGMDIKPYFVYTTLPTAPSPDYCYVGINQNTLPLQTKDHVEKEVEDVVEGPCDNPLSTTSHGEDGKCFVPAEECTEKSAGIDAEKIPAPVEGMPNVTLPGNPIQPTPNKPSLPPEHPSAREPPTFDNADTVTNAGTVQTNPQRLNSPIAQGKITKEELIKCFILACVWGYLPWSSTIQPHPRRTESTRPWEPRSRSS